VALFQVPDIYNAGDAVDQLVISKNFIRLQELIGTDLPKLGSTCERNSTTHARAHHRSYVPYSLLENRRQKRRDQVFSPGVVHTKARLIPAITQIQSLASERKSHEFLRCYCYTKYGAAKNEKREPPQDMQTEFWLNVLCYQKMFSTEWQEGMKGFGPQNFFHLSVHAEISLDEMVLKWDEEALFWMFGEIGSFIIQELKPQDEHEYMVQEASHPEFSEFEVYDATQDVVAWGADTEVECYEWINQDECESCGEWTNNPKVDNVRLCENCCTAPEDDQSPTSE